MKEQEMSDMLENLLNKSGYAYTEAQLDQIGETFATLMSQIFG